MNKDSLKKLGRLLHIIRLFENHPRSYRAREIAEILAINEDTANDYLHELSTSGLLPIDREKGDWFLIEGAVIPHLELSLSYPEAVSLYLAGRLLSQTQDEQNWHVSMALQKLVEALPGTLKEQQKTLLDLLLFTEREGSEQLRDLSTIFQVMASGWVTRTSVRLSYAPPSRRSFECVFDPYLLEPSAIGRTVYAIGYCDVVKDFRTYKLERIQKAELTRSSFDLRPDFKGPEMLEQAWGVMYSDEKPVTVRLRFSAAVTPRVRETRWHPSQKLTLTRDGCEWFATIGDTLEIEPWIRGWGADCEVLEPANLRSQMIVHLQRAIKMYQLAGPPTQAHNPKKLDRSLFKREE
jgi:predicted DNA-binding transcriptional regulator YafY